MREARSIVKRSKERQCEVLLQVVRFLEAVTTAEE